MAGNRFVAVVGARVLPEAWAPQVAAVVRFFVDHAWGVGTGGARGADQYALEAVVATGRLACTRSVVFLPGPVGGAHTAALTAFHALGGRVLAGRGAGRAALLGRSGRLARESSGVVAFLWGPSRGSVFTVREAIRAGKPAAVVLAGGGAELPRFTGGQWVPCAIGPVAAHRWVADAGGLDEPARKLTELGRIFAVPEGEPIQALMEHISTLSQGERLWFEQGIVAGDTVLIPHETLSDTPALLTVPRLMRRFRCTASEAAGLAELFLALDGGRDVVAHYEAEARHRSVTAITEDLVHLVAQLGLAEQVQDADALEDADRLGDAAEAVTTDGRLTERPAPPDAAGAFLGWHALGAVVAELIACAGCGARYQADDEAAELPACPACGTPDTWESRQGPAFRALASEIDGCRSLTDLAALGKRLYGVLSASVHDTGLGASLRCGAWTSRATDGRARGSSGVGRRSCRRYGGDWTPGGRSVGAHRGASRRRCGARPLGARAARGLSPSPKRCT